MFAQRGTERGRQHRLAVAGHSTFGLTNGGLELSDETSAGARQPLEMPTGVDEILEGVADGFNFFQTAEPGAHELSRSEACFAPLRPTPSGPGPGRQACKEQRTHRKRKGGMEYPPHRAQTPPPGRVENLLVTVTVIEDMLPQQQIQMMMAVFVNQIVDEIEIIAIEAVDKREAGPMAITEADDTARVQRDHA